MSEYTVKTMDDLYGNVSFHGRGRGQQASRSNRTLEREGAAIGGFIGNVAGGALGRGNSTVRAAGSSVGAYVGYNVGSNVTTRQTRDFANVVGRGVLSGNFGYAMR